MQNYPEHERALEAAIDAFAAFDVILADSVGTVDDTWGEVQAVLRPTLEAASTAAQDFLAVATPIYRVAYEEAGAPYGPDDDALWRWLADQSATTWLVQEVEAQMNWDLTVSVLRRHIRTHAQATDAHCPHCRSLRRAQARDGKAGR